MRIHILYTFTDGPWGGGNQFLSALRTQLRARGAYAETPEHADVLLCNAHHRLAEALHWRRRLPGLTVLHRLAGVLGTQRAQGWRQDAAVYAFHRLVADGAVLQSAWAREAHRAHGLDCKVPSMVIPNAVDPAVFYAARRDVPPKYPLRVVATSWSRNARKGFALYEWLGQRLDPARFTFTFIGNAPPGFGCARRLEPLAQHALAEALRAHDVYITASEDDACSNALLEALACGLPALALRSGGHPELVGERGVLFEGTDDVLPALETLAARWESFRAAGRPLDIAQVTDRYLACAEAARQARLPRRGARVGGLAALRLRWQLRQARLQ